MNDQKPKEDPINTEGISDEDLPVESVESEVVEEEKDSQTLYEETLEQAAQYKDGWLRARAELDNYRKRVEREREQRETEIRENVLIELLPVMDDFDLALRNIPEKLDNEEWVAGVILIHKKLRSQLDKMGLEEINALGKPFDPNLHEAAMQSESAEHASGTVTSVLRKGYLLRNKVIRPSLVRVAI